MSLVLRGLAGILASTSPAAISCPSSTMSGRPTAAGTSARSCPSRPALDPRLLLLVGRLDDDEGRHAGVLVHLLVHGLPVEDVLEGGEAVVLGHDRGRVGVPLHEQLALLDVLAVLDLEAGAVDDGVRSFSRPFWSWMMSAPSGS